MNEAPTFEQLHKMIEKDLIQFDSGNVWVQIMRVPHGWIYTYMYLRSGGLSSVFVPIKNSLGED